MIGNFESGSNRIKPPLAHCPISKPPAAPRTASSRLSVSICRINRVRLAPIAARIAISRCRMVARTNSRFATFMHANSNTKPASTKNIAAISGTTFFE